MIDGKIIKGAAAMKKQWLLPALALAATMASCAGAVPYGRGVSSDWRQYDQEQRIRDGVWSGELTPGEARQLMRGQREIDMMERLAEAHGVVTPEEQSLLDRKLDNEGARIFRASHNWHSRWHGCGMRHCRHYRYPHYHNHGRIYLGFSIGN
jgi:hypothetical protein